MFSVVMARHRYESIMCFMHFNDNTLPSSGWPTTSWLNCCCPQLVPFCNNTINSPSWNI
ncbi:unnamed protein product [Staurois parvus]|uniref:Uncharacterized protein n=1 Tax=Staurois parvus TaxID=386267 RepID=A0ABN9EC37_9NEOB|nr:unnamed protein product [Staurois parvus]